MKKMLIIAGLLSLMTAPLFAFTETREINKSSWTATNETRMITGSGPNTDFRGIEVSSGQIGGVCTVFDASFPAVGPYAVQGTTIASISLHQIQEKHYNVQVSSGLAYTCTGNGGTGIVILYHIN